jgi:hypothetical protein
VATASRAALTFSALGVSRNDLIARLADSSAAGRARLELREQVIADVGLAQRRPGDEVLG